MKIIFLISQSKLVVGTQKNHLNEKVLLSNPKHMFELTGKRKNLFTLENFAYLDL